MPGPASPAKWHQGHTSRFFEEFALAGAASYQVHDATYRYPFTSYYEAVGPRHPRPQRGLITRPGTAEVGFYREHVTTAVTAAPVYVERPLESDAAAPPQRWLHVDGGLAEVGHDGFGFAFDKRSATPRLARALRHRHPSGDERRVGAVHR